jgi:glycosyltransferase involved in cell wall biosynthesis
MKNLDGALRMLQSVAGSVQFSIYGPLEDAAYWNRCQRLIAQLPATVTAEYCGLAEPDQVGELLAGNDLLFLPSLGENFGHVILEAMTAGCPVLISDRTRWRGLEGAGVGWDVPLESPDRFLDILQNCVAMDGGAWRALSTGARRFGLQFQNETTAREQNRALFLAACESA